MQPALVDSHCHLDRIDLSAHGGDFAAMLATAKAAGVEHCLCVSVDMESFPAMLALVEQHRGLSASVGVHPLYRESAEPTEEQLCRLAAHPRVVAIGESGLDYFYAKEDNSWQRQRFATHIRAARRTGLPLIVHTRGARADTLRLLREEGQGEVVGVLHCFTEDLEMARQAIDMGFLISISGIVTFNNAHQLREVVRALPLDRLLVETDSPWLAPVPHRGKQNEPCLVREVAQCVADLKRLSLDDLARSTSENFFRLFSKAARMDA